MKKENEVTEVKEVVPFEIETQQDVKAIKLLAISNTIDPVNKKELYDVTINPTAESLEELVGKIITLDKWSLTEKWVMNDETEIEELRKVFTCMINGKIYSTISPSFCSSFSDIISIIKDVKKIKVEQRKSSNNRKYLLAIFEE